MTCEIEQENIRLKIRIKELEKVISNLKEDIRVMLADLRSKK